MKFFWDKTKGLKADIKRHRDKEKELMITIASLEKKTDAMSIASLSAYRSFLCQLQQSKADVVTKIGAAK